MTEPVWTILIPTIGQRQELFLRLLDVLLPQADFTSGQVTVHALWNNGERPTGLVRQDLLDSATSQYVSYIDDDDLVPTYYVEKTLPLLDGVVDCIGFIAHVTFKGSVWKPVLQSLQQPVDQPRREDERFVYGAINHLNPTRRDLIKDLRFTDGWPDDADWAQKIAPLLKTEKVINEYMYFYITQDTWRTYPDGRLAVRPPAGTYTRPEIGNRCFQWVEPSS